MLNFCVKNVIEKKIKMENKEESKVKKPVILKVKTHKRLSLLKISEGYSNFDNLINHLLDKYFKAVGEESIKK